MPSEHRLHPASLAFVLAAQLKNFLLPGLFFIVSAGSRGWDWQVWMMWLIVPFTVAAVVRYASFRYRYEASEIVIRTGVLFRNVRHVPYSRIQNLNAVQNLLHRALGVVEVRIETGGGSEAEATLKVLPVAAFEEMRRRVAVGRTAAGVRAAGEVGSAVDGGGSGGRRSVGAGDSGGRRSVGASADSVPVPTPVAQTLLTLSPRELALYGLLEGRGLVVVAAAMGALWEVGISDAILGRLVGGVWTRQQMARWMAESLFGSEGVIVARVVLFVLAFGVLLGFLRVVGGVWGLVRLYGFRLTRVGEDLRTEYGLLTRVATTIPLHRVQTLTVREGPWHRLLGRAAVDVETAGGEGDDEQRSRRLWLAPLIRRADLETLITEVAPDAVLEGAEWHRPHPRAFRRHVKKSLAMAVLLTLPAVAWLGWWSLGWFAVCAAVAVVHARGYIATMRWTMGPGAVGFRSGWIRRHTSVARFAKIQAVATRASPFDRRARMARLRVDTAGASTTAHRVDIPYLAADVAAGLHASLARRAAATEFRW